MNSKKLLALLLVLVMALGVFAACGTPDKPDAPKEYTGAMVENGNTYADPNWLPVVKNPITISAIVRDPLVNGNVYQERTIWKEIADTTGVTIELQVTTATEPEQLMFASRNYPDVAFRIYVDEMQNQAAYAGDIVELTDEMLETYAPNWYNLFMEYPDIYRMCLLPNGKLYFLPQWIMQEHAYELRDAFWINETWLDELGLDIPKTTDDFLNYLRAVKAQAGTGSIPENVAPLWMRCNLVNIGGYYSIMDWYGAFNGFDNDIVVDGKVTHNALNKNIIPAMKYVAQLYGEGLLNDDCMEGNWTKYQEAIGNSFNDTDTPWVGSFFAYSIANVVKPDYIAVAPLDTGTGIKPLVRSFGADNRIIDNAFSIFSTSQYPIAILRTFDHYAVGEGAMRAVIGEEGEDKRWYQLEDGTYMYPEVDEDAPTGNWDTNMMGWNDTAPGIVTPDLVEQLARNAKEDIDSREYIYENLYKPYLPGNMQLYPTDAINLLTTDEASQAELIRTQRNSIINTFARKWIQGKSTPEDDWDMFQTALKNSGIQTRLDLLQKAYDQYASSGLE